MVIVLSEKRLSAIGGMGKYEQCLKRGWEVHKTR